MGLVRTYMVRFASVCGGPGVLFTTMCPTVTMSPGRFARSYDDTFRGLVAML